MRVYGFDSEAEALAAGFVCEGGPAMSVAIITDAQIASGAWKLDGDPFAVVIYTAPDSLPTEGGFAVPVYPVNGWGSAGGSAPLFDSAEIGTVNASALDVTFDQDVSAADYSNGVTIKVNGAATSITSATRQSNHAIVRYVIPVLWHGSGDAVTWEYASGSGNIIAESGATALGDVTAQSVTNNCEYAALLDLQADTLALADSDPVSTWADQSGQGHDFTQTGSARPILVSTGGVPALARKTVYFDGSDDWMLGGDWAIGSSFAVMLVGDVFSGSSTYSLSKWSNASNPGWFIFGFMTSLQIFQDIDNIKSVSNDDIYNAYPTIATYINDNLTLALYVQGSNANESPNVIGNVSNYSNNEPVRIGTNGEGIIHSEMELNALLIFSPLPSAANRAALEARLAARYGVTL